MGVSKILINGVPKIDVAQTTVTADKLAVGYTALGADGELVTGTASHDWMGENPYFIEKFYNLSTNLKAVGFEDWTAGTTATIIDASASIKTFSAAITAYDYIVEWLFDVHYAYTEGATLKYMINRNYGALYQVIHRRSYGIANFATEEHTYNYCTSLYTASAYNIYYGKTAGTLSWTTTQYGCYPVVAAHTFSSTTGASPTVTLMTPNITARCAGSYFATARKAEIDCPNSTFKLIGNLYRVDADTTPLSRMYDNAVHLYSNPL